MKKGAPPRFTFKQRAQIWLAYRLGRLLIGAIGRTLRFQVEGWDNYQSLRQANQPAILSFWHDQIPVATYFWRNRGIVVMTSEHFDGEYIARIIESFGYATSRGSSTRGGVRALLQLKRRLREGRDVAFTIDGPRGPRHKVKPGPLLLSRKSGCPIVCFHIQPQRYWQLGSWDRMRIPKPFSKALVRIGSPFYLREQDSHQQWMDTYQREMNRLGC
ncbi:MAG TPA: lysophospholipid acyltransferase family protein [Acidobacteriota bacterium]|nr:lysophospholipid acyltransferase family protein [Acidobacteriota bacterium]